MLKSPWISTSSYKTGAEVGTISLHLCCVSFRLIWTTPPILTNAANAFSITLILPHKMETKKEKGRATAKLDVTSTFLNDVRSSVLGKGGLRLVL